MQQQQPDATALALADSSPEEDERIPVVILASTWANCCGNLTSMLRERGWNSIRWSSSFESLHNQFSHAKSLVLLLLNATDYRPAFPAVCTVCPAGTPCSLAVYICINKNFTSPALQNIETLRHGLGHLLVIFQDKVSALPREELMRYTTARKLEVKTFRSLYVDLVRHSLVPAHRRMSDTEASGLLEKLKCTRDKLPIIHITDPVCRYYDFPVGAIIEILRPDVYYRCVAVPPSKTNYEKFFSI
jgi:DNA-directed RNA polymerase subunit H (RpoH/RPB5)